MKKIILSGSMAYDRLMTFPDQFSNHLLPDKLNAFNISFMVVGATEEFGGTAGNVAFGLKLMGEEPLLSATLGRDHFRYTGWLDANGLSKEFIVIVESELTAGCYITKDQENNELTIFNPGAMKKSSALDFDALDATECFLLISPGNLDDMLNYPRECRKRGIEYIFDPGQNIPLLPKEEFIEVIQGAKLFIVNSYECDLAIDKAGIGKQELVQLAENTIITLGKEGAEIYTENTMIHIPPCTAQKIVDPAGAGDAFRAGLISGLLSGKPIVESALQGSVCGSFAVESEGTQNYRFTNQQFQERLTTLR